MQLTSRMILILVLTAGFSFGQKVLTLNEAINIALQRNTTLQKSQNNLTTALEVEKTAYGQLLPTLGASGSWSWNRTESEKGGSVNVYGGSVAVQTNESRYFSAGLSTDWTLFDGMANLSTMYQAKNSLESTKLTLEKVKQDVVFQTMSYYYDLMNNEILLKVKDEDLQWNTKQLETITERNKLGAVTLADVYAQQVKVGNAELAIVQANNAYETSKSNLLYFLGLDVLESYQFKDPIADQNSVNEKFSNSYSDISDLVSKALKSRSDYLSLRYDLQNSYEGIVQAKAGHLPRLSNSMSFGYSGNSVSSMFDTKRYSIGLNLSVPIFSGWSVENRVQAAKVSAMNKEIEVSDLERDIKRNIQKTYLDLQAAEKRLEVTRKNVVAAEENRKIEAEKYSLGSGTLLNVLISNTEFTTAQTNLVNAQFEYARLKAQILYLLGTLDYKKFE